jgi:hypothetical protein
MADANPSDEVVGGSPEELRAQALRRIKKRRDFHAHLFVYLVVNLALWGIWWALGGSSGGGSPWPIWLTLAWGLGVVFNAWDVYVRRPITEAEIHEEMHRLGHRS